MNKLTADYALFLLAPSFTTLEREHPKKAGLSHPLDKATTARTGLLRPRWNWRGTLPVRERLSWRIPTAIQLLPNPQLTPIKNLHMGAGTER